MSAFLVKTLNHVGGLVSLVNTLHPKVLHIGGEIWRRRRDVLRELLQHSGACERGVVGGADSLGLGGWVAERVVHKDEFRVVLTAALDCDSLADLRSDDLSSTTAVNVAVARFCLRQAQEGRLDEAFVQARMLLDRAADKHNAAQGKQNASKKASPAPALCDSFYAHLFQLIPFAEVAGDKTNIVPDLVMACFRSVPCTATAAALVRYPGKQTVQEMRKLVAAGAGLSAHQFPLAFGCYAVLGFKETAMQAFATACRILDKATLFSEAEAIVRALGPLSLEASPLASGQGAGGCPAAATSSWIVSLVESISSRLPTCPGFLELEVGVLGMLQVGALVEPGAILPTLHQQVELVIVKILKECAKKLPAERMSEIRAQFVEWITCLKQIYHTRPAVVSEDMRKLWDSVAVVHARRIWPAASCAAPASETASVITVYRVRGPSLSSEWESVAAVLKNRVGRKANIWRDVKAAGIST